MVYFEWLNSTHTTGAVTSQCKSTLALQDGDSN